MLASYFYNATLTIYRQESKKNAQGETRLVYIANSAITVKGMKSPRANFEEASGYGAFLAPGAPFSVEGFSMESSVNCPIGSIIRYEDDGEDSGNYYEVLSREQRSDWYFGSQTVVAKRVEQPSLI